MGSESEVSPPRSAVRGFFSSLAGMISIGLAAGFVLFIPFFIYLAADQPGNECGFIGSSPAPSRRLLQRKRPSRPRASNNKPPAVDQFTPNSRTADHGSQY